MDPISHAVIGGAIALANGGEVNLSNAFLVAGALGGMSPDLDIVYRVRGEVKYLKEHRGFSHSIPGLVLLAAGISGILSFFYPSATIAELFLWAFIGGLSHTFFDFLNSYGVELLGPFNKKKYTVNLLQIADPVILCLFGLAYGFVHFGLNPYPLYGGVILYLFIRLMMKEVLKKRVRKFYGDSVERVVMLPALLGIFNWDYICFTEDEIKVGKINYWDQPKPWGNLISTIDDSLTKTIMESEIGKFFSNFSPYLFMAKIKEGEKVIVKIFDIRYYTRGRFLHSATCFIEKGQVVSGLFHPFNERKKYII